MDGLNGWSTSANLSALSVDLDSWLVAYLDSVTGSLSSFFTHARVSLAPNGASTRVGMDLSGPSQPFLHGGTLLQPSFDWPEVHGSRSIRLVLDERRSPCPRLVLPRRWATWRGRRLVTSAGHHVATNIVDE